MKQRILRISPVLALVLAVVSGGMLYSVSQKVHHAERELHAVERKLSREHEAIRILQAEWDYLNHPARLEALARQYFDAANPPSENVATDASVLPDVFLPALPHVKPPPPTGFVKPKPVPAAYKPEPQPAKTKKPEQPRPLPRKKAVSKQNEDSFNALLGRLNDGGVR